MIEHEHMKAVIDACQALNLRCVEVFHSDGMKLIFKVASEGGTHVFEMLIARSATYDALYRELLALIVDELLSAKPG